MVTTHHFASSCGPSHPAASSISDPRAFFPTGYFLLTWFSPLGQYCNPALNYLPYFWSIDGSQLISCMSVPDPQNTSNHLWKPVTLIPSQPCPTCRPGKPSRGFWKEMDTNLELYAGEDRNIDLEVSHSEGCMNMINQGGNLKGAEKTDQTKPWGSWHLREKTKKGEKHTDKQICWGCIWNIQIYPRPSINSKGERNT